MIMKNHLLHRTIIFSKCKSCYIWIKIIPCINGIYCLKFRLSSSPFNKKISYVSQEMASNLTSVPILDEDLHVFIPNDSELENSLKVLFHLYSLRKRWIHEYWLLDISNLPASKWSKGVDWIILILSFIVTSKWLIYCFISRCKIK